VVKQDDSELIGSLRRSMEAARERRAVWDSQYERVAQLVLPDYVQTFIGGKTPGQEVGQMSFDATANTALFRFAAAMESMLTPRSSRWHRIRITNPDLMKKRAVQLWCDQVNDAMFAYRYAQSANFQSQQHDGYVSIGAFGTAGLFIDQLRSRTGERGLRYANVPLGDMFMDVNHQGIVDTIHRRVPMTIRTVAQRWGADALPEKLRARLQDKPDDPVCVWHTVRPREDWDPERLDAKGMPFGSYYYFEDDYETLLDEGGYATFPYATARYRTAPGELYGRSPAMAVLPALRVLNQEKKTLLKAGHRAVDPVLLAHDDGVVNGLSLRPGAVNPGGVNADGRPLVHALPVGDLQDMKPLMDDERAAINDAFLVTLFQISIEPVSGMTATEVMERAREKGAMLSPTMGRFQSESLGPMIDREYRLLNSMGLLPPPPPELLEAGAKWMPVYDAPLNRAMRAEEGVGLQRSVQFGIELAQATQDPSVLDVFDFDAALPELADINSVPYRWLADPQVVAAKRKQRQQAQQTQQLVQAGPAIASTLAAVAPKGSPATQAGA
jgi:hypothetical protein